MTKSLFLFGIAKIGASQSFCFSSWNADSWSSPQIYFLFFWCPYRVFEKSLGKYLHPLTSVGDSLNLSQFISKLINKVLRLTGAASALNRFGILLVELEEGQVHFLHRGRLHIPTVFSWGDSISPDGFLPFTLLFLVIIVAVVIVVTVIMVVVVVGEGSSIIKLSFVIIGSLHRIAGANEFTGQASSVRVQVEISLCVLVQFLWENNDSVRSNQRMRPTAPSVPLKLKGASYENSPQSQILKGSNSGDGGNTGDGGKTVGGAIGARGGGIGDSLLVALYACMTFIYGSSWKGEMASEAKRYLVKSSEGSKEVFPGEAGK
ncbi:hypothetical protein Tco_1113987 [Tanacetum coccineum]|uniref:Uncharacterized protein n=1 Tax=Tanacetum coccineum TaxID=301880 RepID=A0ABQ5IU06_9ASTR